MLEKYFSQGKIANKWEVEKIVFEVEVEKEYVELEVEFGHELQLEKQPAKVEHSEWKSLNSFEETRLKASFQLW